MRTVVRRPWAASTAALRAPLIATQATGTPGGIVDLSDNSLTATFGTPGANVKRPVCVGDHFESVRPSTSM